MLRVRKRTGVGVTAQELQEELRAGVTRVVPSGDAAAIVGPALTPWLLARIGELTDGASIRANTALIVNNAGVAGALAVLLA